MLGHQEYLQGIRILYILMHLIPEHDEDQDIDTDDLDPNAGRFVRYQFTPHFLKLKTVGAT